MRYLNFSGRCSKSGTALRNIHTETSRKRRGNERNLPGFFKQFVFVYERWAWTPPPHLSSPPPPLLYNLFYEAPALRERNNTRKKESVRCRGDSAARTDCPPTPSSPQIYHRVTVFLCNLSPAPPREDTFAHCGHGASGCTLLHSSLPGGVYRPLCLGMSTQPTLKLMMFQLNVNQQRSSKFVIQRWSVTPNVWTLKLLLIPLSAPHAAIIT